MNTGYDSNDSEVDNIDFELSLLMDCGAICIAANGMKSTMDEAEQSQTLSTEKIQKFRDFAAKLDSLHQEMHQLLEECFNESSANDSSQTSHNLN